MKLLTNQLRFKTGTNPEYMVDVVRHPGCVQIKVERLPDDFTLLSESFPAGNLSAGAALVDRVHAICRMSSSEVNMLFQAVVALDTLRE